MLYKYPQKQLDFISFFYYFKAILGSFEYTAAIYISPDPSWQLYIKSKMW